MELLVIKLWLMAKTFSRFACVIGECETFKDKYEPIGFELQCYDTIS